MDWQLSPYTIPLVITGLITLASAAYTFRQRHIAGSFNLLLLLLCISLWLFSYAAELSAGSLAAKLFWAQVKYVGMVYLPTGYILFVLKHIGLFQKIKKTRQFTALLHVIPLLTLTFTWTNEAHQLIWRATSLGQSQSASYLLLEYGAWFWLHVAFANLMMIVGTLFLLRKVVTTPKKFQGQFILLIVGSLFPWVANILHITGANPFPNLDLTPFAFMVTAVCFTLALVRFNFLDIVPIARELVMEKLENGVIVLDSQNRVLDINQTAVALLKKDKNQIIGRQLNLTDPNWLPLALALEEGQTSCLELLNEQTFYEVSIISLENINDRANGRLITLHNITRRKEAELLMQHAKETAEAANLAKNQFLTNMSHEIRTPLNAVLGMAELLRQTNLNTNQTEMVDVVAKSSNQLMLLINNILDFAHLEAGNLTLNHQSFDLIDCIEASLEHVRQAANEKLITLSYKIDDQTPTKLAGDPVRLRQILVNLLENGIKFSEEGSVHLSITHLPKNDTVLLKFIIQDSGIGITTDQISKLFVPFQQVDGSLTRTHGGNGLGLVICKRLAELMDGDIYLHSEVGQGTSVHVTVQMRLPTEADPTAVTLRQNSTSLAGKRLLIIADNAAQRRQISKEARLAGLEIYVAGSAQEADYWIENSLPFDAALVETAVWQHDPGILSQLQNRETGAPLPTILLSASKAELNHLMAAEPALFAGSLTLPIHGPQLYDLLLNTLSVIPKKTSQTTAAQPGETMAARHPLNILLVEDNKLNRRVIKNMLDKLGYQADTAVNGRVAVDITKQQAYDIILMDIQMPEMDGLEATKQILADSSRGKQPYIIAVTAHALPGDRENYLAAGMNDYLSKPVTSQSLVEALYHGIQFQAQAAVIDPPPTPQPTPLATAADPTDEPIDLEELARLVGEDTGEFLAMMAPFFLEDAAKLLQALGTAVQNQDSEAILHSAHTLKGTSASMGMPKLSQFSRELEMMAKAKETAAAPQKLAQIEAEYHRVQAALAKISATAV